MKKIFILTVVVLVIVSGVLYVTKLAAPTVTEPAISSFEECVKAGNAVMESYPRQCRAGNGKTFVEKLAEKTTYMNASSDMIVVNLPFPGAVTGKTFSVKGKARGTWFFEASFPVTVLDKDGKVLAQGVAQAESDWMTTEFVPFTAEMKIPATYIGKATLVLKRDNPSGIPEKDASIAFPITIEY